jgi:type IV pilus assembly protein PilV
MRIQQLKNQHGVFLIEAMIGILIFTFGVIALVRLQAASIAIQSDAQYRIEAANLADQMMGDIVLNVDRTSPATLTASLITFRHQQTVTGNCDYTGTPSANPLVTAWVNRITTPATSQLAGSLAAMHQILVDNSATGFNEVTINLCWQSPTDRIPRRHSLISYVN